MSEHKEITDKERAHACAMHEIEEVCTAETLDVERMVVPGGWLYFAWIYSDRSGGPSDHFTTTFVPNP